MISGRVLRVDRGRVRVVGSVDEVRGGEMRQRGVCETAIPTPVPAAPIAVRISAGRGAAARGRGRRAAR